MPRPAGPTIEAIEGERIRIYVTNRLAEPTTVHWHGLILPNGMDGVAGLNQPPIPPGETWVYEFDLREPGTFMYHSHYDEMTQIALGMMGMFIVHPHRRVGSRVDRDFHSLESSLDTTGNPWVVVWSPGALPASPRLQVVRAP